MFKNINRHDGGITTADEYDQFLQYLRAINLSGLDKLIVLGKDTLRFSLDAAGIQKIEEDLHNISPKIIIESLRELGLDKFLAAVANQDNDASNRRTEESINHNDALMSCEIHPLSQKKYDDMESTMNDIYAIIDEKGYSGLDEWIQDAVDNTNEVGVGKVETQQYLMNRDNYKFESTQTVIDHLTKLVRGSGAEPCASSAVLWLRSSKKGQTKSFKGLDQEQLCWALSGCIHTENIKRSSVAVIMSEGSKRDNISLWFTRLVEIMVLGGVKDIFMSSPNRLLQEDEDFARIFYAIRDAFGITIHYTKYYGRVSHPFDPLHEPTFKEIALLSLQLEKEKRDQFKKATKNKKQFLAGMEVNLNYGPFIGASEDQITYVVKFASNLAGHPSLGK